VRRSLRPCRGKLQLALDLTRGGLKTGPYTNEEDSGRSEDRPYTNEDCHRGNSGVS